MHGVEEPWCNNKGVAILPFIIKDDGSCYFMQTCESNPLFNKNKLGKYSSITGGVENNNPLETVYNEMLEETGIFLTKDTPIYFLGTHYTSKISTKVWYYYAIDLTALNLDINDKYYGYGDGTIGENSLYSKFIPETELRFSNDSFSLTIYGKLFNSISHNCFKNINFKTLLNNYCDSKAEIFNSATNNNLKRNIFISGIANNYEEFGTIKKNKKFVFDLSNFLCKKNKKIINAFGIGVGDEIVSGAVKYSKENSIALDKILDIWPFPQQLKKSWPEYCNQLIDKADIVLFIFGNKMDENNNIVLSKGVLNEFEIARNKNKIIIPIASTGYDAKQIFIKIENDIENFKYLKDYLHVLKNEKNAAKIVKTIMQILDNIN
ncbi:hypothetical protein [Spiroplasma ixodetis]|uniref:hypothetical protein n=1 Tax=Spiroplasma ixodetis TaxID=2141 RepID=UPI002575F09C|nr:hypothetical protein [Spiroplasma ixodetis]WJG70825.1 hypothetical protein SIXOD_v1c20860 [Spiroplasma ixodetis Y32]